MGANGGVEKVFKRQLFEVGEDEEDVHVCPAQETPTMLPKRKAGRPRKSVRVKIEESEAGRNWPDSEVYALIDVRGEMESDFVKNAKKQGQNFLYFCLLINKVADTSCVNLSVLN